ncbi:MAG: glycosyltransferase family 61 protein [Endomicrobium sp.]|jgi:hypothetical protein|nr:glycosyltransferase family 61 protein [Endomicrobium sp.]
MDKIYGSDDFIKMFNEYASNIKEDTKELKKEIYDNAFILPFRDSSNLAEIDNEGGVFDSNGNIADLSKTRKTLSHVKVGYPPHYRFNSDVVYRDEDVVFLGYFSSHFGHFILESLNRLWIYFDSGMSNKKAVYIGESDVFFIEILELFGLNKNNVERITKPAKFRSVVVPEESGLIFGSSYNKKHNEIYKRIRDNVKGREYDKIYLSRTKFNKRETSVAGEQEIEKVFQDNGFKIIYPEHLRIEEQISLMKNCKHLAGIQGTAMHLSLFADDGIKLTVVFRAGDDIFSQQIKINKMKNIDYTGIKADLDFLRPFPYGMAYAVSVRNKYMKQWLKDSRYEYNDTIYEPNSLEDYISAEELKRWSRISTLKKKIKEKLVMFITNFIFIKSLRKRIRYKLINR